jgi:hypothetical protein
LQSINVNNEEQLYMAVHKANLAKEAASFVLENGRYHITQKLSFTRSPYQTNFNVG